jgi:hypothetical protein
MRRKIKCLQVVTAERMRAATGTIAMKPSSRTLRLICAVAHSRNLVDIARVSTPSRVLPAALQGVGNDLARLQTNDLATDRIVRVPRDCRAPGPRLTAAARRNAVRLDADVGLHVRHLDHGSRGCAPGTDALNPVGRCLRDRQGFRSAQLQAVGDRRVVRQQPAIRAVASIPRQRDGSLRRHRGRARGQGRLWGRHMELHL